MKLAGVAALAMMALGCADGYGARRPAQSGPVARSPAELKEALQRVLANSKDDAERQLTWPRCEIPAKPGRCGLAIDRWATPEGREAFQRAHPCPAEQSSEQCLQLWGDAFRNELPAFYPRADRQEIGQFCSSNRSQCETLTDLELAWLKSHNAAIFAEWEKRDRRLIDEHLSEGRRYLANQHAEVDAAERELAKAERRRAAARAVGAAFQAAGASMQPGPSECTSDYSCRVGWKCIKTTNGSFCAGR